MFVAQLFLQPLQLGVRRFLRFGFAVGFRWHAWTLLGLLELRIDHVVGRAWMSVRTRASRRITRRSRGRLAVGSRRKRGSHLLQVARQLPQPCDIRRVVFHLFTNLAN